MRIDHDDRIALLGSNGNGKSTFAKLIAEKLAPESGSFNRANKLSIAYFAQHQMDELRPAETPYQHIARLVPDWPEAKADDQSCSNRSTTRSASVSGRSSTVASRNSGASGIS